MTLSRLFGISFLLTAKGMDLATTAAALLGQPGGEANPLAAWLFDAVGLSGLAGLAVGLCLAVIIATETAATTVRVYTSWGPPTVRVASYGSPAGLWTVVAIRNVHQIAGVIA